MEREGREGKVTSATSISDLEKVLKVTHPSANARDHPAEKLPDSASATQRSNSIVFSVDNDATFQRVFVIPLLEQRGEQILIYIARLKKGS